MSAPVVYIVPGFGAHRLAGNELGLAELVYKKGFSAVSISSTFRPEFMEHASTSDVPSYPPDDVRDLHIALTQIDHRLDGAYRHRLGARALTGYSCSTRSVIISKSLRLLTFTRKASIWRLR